jgi:hypothetical protein
MMGLLSLYWAINYVTIMRMKYDQINCSQTSAIVHYEFLNDVFIGWVCFGVIGKQFTQIRSTVLSLFFKISFIIKLGFA